MKITKTSTSTVEDVDDEFGDAASGPSTIHLNDDIDDEFGDTTVDDSIEHPKPAGKIPETTGNERQQPDELNLDPANIHQLPEGLRRKMFKNLTVYPPKFENEYTKRCMNYESTQMIEYPKYSALTAEEQRQYINYWLMVRKTRRK